MRRALSWLLLAGWLGVAAGASAFDWVPSEQEIQKYRQSWNPLSNGPLMIVGVDIQPKGQWLVHPYVFSQISQHEYRNRFTFASEREGSRSGHAYAVQPLVGMA